MIVLALETTGRHGSVALLRDDVVLVERAFEPHRGHGGRLLVEVEAACRAAHIAVDQIDLFAACSGPGSFTGLRVGLSTATAMAWAAGKRATGIGSLEALAWNEVAEIGVISPILDARKGEVYGQLYRSDGAGLAPLCPAVAVKPDDWKCFAESHAGGDAVRYLGSGVAAYPDHFGVRPADHAIHASVLARLAAGHMTSGTLPEARPCYIRPSEAEVKFGAAPSHDPLEEVD